MSDRKMVNALRSIWRIYNTAGRDRWGHMSGARKIAAEVAKLGRDIREADDE